MKKQWSSGKEVHVIYFDNASTTLAKPPSVAEAVVTAMETFGGVGRGVHEISLAAGMAVYEAREQVAHLLGAPSAGRVSFTVNATESLNIIITGLLLPGDHAITTSASHNSVLRPLYRKREQGGELSILPVAPDGSIDYEAFDTLFCPNTRLVVMTHASNLTGDIYDIGRMADICHAHGAIFAVDAAQTAGVVPINMERMGIDIVAFTGHKSLFGPQGTGGLCVADGIEIPSFKVGGSGTHSYDERHPTLMPESLEAGTLNSHGIAGLAAGLAYIEQVGIQTIAERIGDLTGRFEKGISAIQGIRIYGGHGGIDRCGIVALNVGDFDSAMVGDHLNTDFGICIRTGAHCAPLMHQALGTVEQGAVRFSFSHFNTEEEIDTGIAAVTRIAEYGAHT